METQATIRVQCYAGYRGEETPRRFVEGDRRVEVIEVVDTWLAPDHRYFKVVGDDGFTYLLRHDVARDRWRLAGSGRQASGLLPRNRHSLRH
ncbi:MAG: hypothetical protein GY769_25850 [bacterium]|nr:hypothetical protein [bacterium]